MADQANEKPDAAASVANAQEAPATETKANEPALAKEDESKLEGTKAPENAEKPDRNEKPAGEDGDTEMKDATGAPNAGTTATEGAPTEEPAPAPADTPANKNKSRRKSSAGEAKGKSLNKKGSKARLTHLDAKPGDHFLVKLKGFPAWPAIICDESMLPHALVNSRPVTAPRPDGTYSEQYADGGKRAHDRSFPVMYLYTNEFGWVSNTALSELSPERARETITDKMRKDLKEAFQLAADNNPLDHYKDILKKFQEELIAQEEAKREAAATPKKSKKGKGKATDDEDVDMADADDKSKAKKRKAEDDATTPQRPDSVKKPKIKLNTSSTPKTNGATPKGKDESAAKKSKPKKNNDKKADASNVPKEPKETPEERHARKGKEILFLRHRLQRGLLTRDQKPQESEMSTMSEYIKLLENSKDLEVSIIRATKINKVLKAILKLETIPKEEEFHFKERSQALLDKWNKLLASDETPAPVATNGVNGSSETKAEGKKAEANGVKENTKEDKAGVEAGERTGKSVDPTPDGAEEKATSEKPIEATA